MLSDRSLRIVGKIYREGWGLIVCSFEVEVESAWFVNFDQLLEEVFLVEYYFVIEGAFDKMVVVFDVREDRTRLVALANGDLDIAYFADLY